MDSRDGVLRLSEKGLALIDLQASSEGGYGRRCMTVTFRPVASPRRGDGAFLAVLYIDLDHFKPVNDTYGHSMGDELLRQFGARLRVLVRPTDAVARLGGDEFGVVLADVREPKDAAMVADKVVEMAARAFEVDGKVLSIGASVGVAFDAGGDAGWKGLVKRADEMVYTAKAAGRGRCAVASARTCGELS